VAEVVEEPTVDEQRANPAIVMAPASRDASTIARLIVAQGNDSGQELAISAGRTYTIGRGLDNDFVLTDIAVSRKHFDLRNEDGGAWVIVDRGSGNGTVVNGNLEDNPFMLANGDLIEIGNTVFRFEQANGASRPKDSFSVDIDDDELSTVAG
jgi:pSer/pThr/pTyr-binding forkhead associated (FHA) protein